jgi:hypothetical protein
VRDPQWVRNQCRRIGGKFRIGDKRNPTTPQAGQRSSLKSAQCSGPNGTDHSLQSCNSSPNTCVAWSAFIKLRGRQLLRCCRDWPYAHREIPVYRRSSFHRRTQSIFRRHNGLLAIRGWNHGRLSYRFTLRERTQCVCRLVNLRHDPTSKLCSAPAVRAVLSLPARLRHT